MVKYKEYPNFNRGEIQAYYKKIPKKERDIFEDFLRYVSITAGERRVDTNKRCLTQFRMIVERSLEKITLKDLRDYLALLNSSNKTNYTRNDLKACIKRFLKWKYKDWSQRFSELKDIKLIMRMNEEKINSNTLITKEEVEKIMKEEKNIFWLTFFITLYESGLRPVELRNLKWNNIKFNVEGELSEINIFATKTYRARSVFVQESTKFLRALKQKNDDNNPLVFPSIRDKNKPIGKGTAGDWLSKITERVLGRKVHPYLLRHSRATELYTNANVPDKIVQKFLGHSKSMGDVYTHLSNKDVKESLAKSIYQINGLPEEKKHELEIEVGTLKKSVILLLEGMKKNIKGKQGKKISKSEAQELVNNLNSLTETKKNLIH